MRTSHAGLAVLSGLAATVTADALPPDDIPMLCVTICGPIVELSSICNVEWKELKRRKVDWLPVEAVTGEEQAQDSEARIDDMLEKVGGSGMGPTGQLERRSFSVIVAAPTSFSFELPADTTLDLRPTSMPTRITPTIDVPSSVLPSSLPLTTSTSFVVNNTPVQGSTTSFTTATSATNTAHWSGNYAKQKGQEDSSEDPEKTCLCLNRSFDVPKVAGLCSSCIALAGYPENNMNVIMSDCNFTSLTWSPAKDSVVDNVRVKATKPSVSAGSQVAFVSSSNALKAVDLKLVMGVVAGLVLGMGFGALQM